MILQRNSAARNAQRTIWAKSSASSDAPPTRAPSISGWAIRAAMFPGFTLPPYWMRTAAAGPSPAMPATIERMVPMVSLASSGVALRPVPMAQIGS